MASIAQVVVRFGVDLKDFTTKMQKATREIQAMGRQMQSTGRNLTQGLTVPLLALGGASVKLASDFDESMTKIQTLVGISGDVVDGFRDSVLDLAGETAQAPAELADALFTVTSAGLRGAEAMEVLEMAAKGSAIGMGETKEIARAVTAVMQAYGPETMSAAKAMDVLTATVREGNLEASELAPVLGRVVGLAAQMGVGFDQVGASIATFTRLGVDSAEAVTGLRGFLSGIIKPTNEGAEALASMGMSFAGLRKSIEQDGLAQTMVGLIRTFDGNVEALSSVIPNVRALGAVMGTAGVQGKAYLEIQDSLANSTGILNEAFEKTAKSGSFQLKQAFNQLKELATDMGAVILPVVANLAESLRGLFLRFSQLSQETKETIIKVAAFAAAIGPAVYIVGTMMASVGALIKTMRTLSIFLATNPWFALAGAIGVVVTAIMGYTKISGAVSNAQKSSTDAVKEEQKELNNLVNTITRLNPENEARERLLSSLKEQYPDFIKSLGDEELSNANLQKALKAVNQEYATKLAFAAAEEELTEILKKQAKARADIDAAERANTELRKQIDYSDSIDGQSLLTKEMDANTASIQINTSYLEKLKLEAQEVKGVYQELASSLNIDAPAPDLNNEDTGGGKRGGLFKGVNAELQRGLPLLGEYGAKLKDFSLDYETVTKDALTFKDVVVGSFDQIGSQLTNVFVGMLDGTQGVFKQLGNFILGLIKQLAAAAIAAAILSALLPGGQSKVASGVQAASTFGTLFKNFAGFRAAGGPVSSGKSYIVGEKGPELFTPSGSGAIIPNHALGSAGGSGKMQLQIVGNVPITFQPTGTLTAAIKQEQIRLKKIGG